MPNETDTAFNYRLLKLIEQRPEISQRELAAELDLSLGKINYCLKAFVSRGLVKVNNFRRSDNKRAYVYLLTPQGIEEKARVTVGFFKRVEAEYETLKQEVAHLDRQQDFPADTDRILSEVMQKIRASLPDVMAAYLFGSAASGKIHPESDIDMAVLADSPVDPERLWKLAQDVAAMLNVEIDLIDLRMAPR
jgi:EPS-associated MarR family transcriptional regulator